MEEDLTVLVEGRTGVRVVAAHASSV